MLIDKEMLNNSISYRSGDKDIDQETTDDSCLDKHSDSASSVDGCESLVVVECDTNTTSDIPTTYRLANPVLVKSSNRKMDDNIALGSQNRTNTDDIAKSSRNDILQDENRETNAASVPKIIVRRKELKSSASVDATHRNGLCCKMLIVFAICWIIVCWLVPVILFYANRNTDIDNAVTDPGYSKEKNISTAMVHCKLSAHVHILACN